MIKQLLSATCVIALLASCSRQTPTASFQRASTESVARQTVAVAAPTAVSAPGAMVAEVPASTQLPTTAAPVAAEPVLVASAATEADIRTVAAPSRSQARQVARVQEMVANAKAPQAVGATETRKLTGAERMISKIVAKKINKQVAKGQKTKAIGGNVAIGIVLIGVAIILGLLSVNGILTGIVAAVGVLFLILGLLNSAALTNLF